MTVKSIELGDIQSSPIDSLEKFIPSKNSLDILSDVEVHLQARIGTTLISVSELFSLKKGNTLTLEQLVTDPVELMFNNKLIGRGELVAAGEYFGVRITEIE